MDSRNRRDGAAIEEGDCGGEKQAVIHLAQIMDDGSTWIIEELANESLQGFKPRFTTS